MTAASKKHKNPRLEARLRLGQAALVWERLWPALWPALGIAGLFAAIALLDWLPRLPSTLHFGLLACFAALLLAALWHGFAGFAWPSQAAARRRLELTNNLAHRPLTALEDTYAGAPDDPGAKALWRIHRRRLRAQVARLKVGWPAPGMARRDPLALRALLFILLVAAVITARGDYPARLEDALWPGQSGSAGAGTRLEAWVTPPAYTGLPPTLLSGRGDAADPAPVPAGSTLLARLHGEGPAVLRIDRRPTRFDPVDGANLHAQTTITAGSRVTVEQAGRSLAVWPIRLIPDLPPSIAWSAPPAATAHARLHLDYQAGDDYGVVSVTAVLQRQANTGETLKVALAAPEGKAVHGTDYLDLASHPWAGQAVRLRLMATDAAGQTAETETVTLVLPERSFANPVARAIVAARKQLDQGDSARTPVMAVLDTISADPKSFRDDTVVFLGLRVARSRLLADNSDKAIPSVQDLLWQTALRVEDGALSSAERDLHDAGNALQKALSQKAGPREIETLAAQLQAALERTMRAMADRMRNNPLPPDLQASSLTAKALDQKALQNVIRKIAELARNGDLDAARKLLAALQEGMENLKPGPTREQIERMRQADKLMQDLRDLRQKQQALLDQTFRRLQAQNGKRMTPKDEKAMEQDAAQQQALRRSLSALDHKLAGSGAREAMAKAGQAMDDGASALQQASPHRALDSQARAVEALRQAAQAISQQAQQEMGGLALTMPGQGPGSEGDPFGRSGSALDRSDVRLPAGGTVRKAGEILQELRRRAGEADRPQLELEYLNRLLERY